MSFVFASKSYRAASTKVSQQRVVNAYAELQPKDAKAQVPVFGSPGVTDFATLGDGPIRGMFEMVGTGYAVSGGEFYSFTSDGTSTLLGSGITGSSVVDISGNGTQIAITNGSAGYLYDSSDGTFDQISNSNFYAPETVTFIDQYFVFNRKGTGKFFLSGLFDGASYAALDTATAEANPDLVLAVRNRNGALVVLGAQSIEFWDDTGASSFPFQRIKGATLDRGILASHALSVVDLGLFFLGDDRVFYRLDGGALRRVSNHAVEQIWETYDTVSDAFCFELQFNGHKWVVLTFPTANATWVTDVATGYMWHERVTYDARGNENRWRVNAAAQVFNRQFVGDRLTGKIGYLDQSTYSEFGDNIIMELVSPPIHGDGRNVVMPCFELDMETGVGLVTGQGSDPQVMLSIADDGGEFLPIETWGALGAIGKRGTRVIWWGLGDFQERTMKVRISDPVKRVVVGARTPGLEVLG